MRLNAGRGAKMSEIALQVKIQGTDLIDLRLTRSEIENLIFGGYLRIFGDILEGFWRFFEELWRKWFVVRR